VPTIFVYGVNGGHAALCPPYASIRHCEEPAGLAFGEPEGRLRDEAIQASLQILDCFRLRPLGFGGHVAVLAMTTFDHAAL
jgi:hypothetical protein